MKTVTINKEALQKISSLVPGLNQADRSVNVNVEFYSFSDVVWTIQSLLDVASNMMMNCSDGDEKRVLDVSNNLIRMAHHLVPEFIVDIQYRDNSNLEEVPQQ